MEIPFEHQQQIRTEEMEALQGLIDSFNGLKSGYKEDAKKTVLGEGAALAIQAIDQCIELLDEHIDSRADSL